MRRRADATGRVTGVERRDFCQQSRPHVDRGENLKCAGERPELHERF